MRWVWAALGLVSFAGCPGGGYQVNLTVTVPPEVQTTLSPTHPGLILGHRLVVGEICQPSDVPFSVPFTFSVTDDRCEEAAGQGYENMYLVRLSDDDVTWFSVYQATALCGQSRPITDLVTIDAVMDRAGDQGWDSEKNQRIADGTGGACDAAGNYTGTVVLKPFP